MCDVRSYEAVTTCNKCIKCRNDTPSWTVTVCTDDGPQWAPRAHTHHLLEEKKILFKKNLLLSLYFVPCLVVTILKLSPLMLNPTPWAFLSSQDSFKIWSSDPFISPSCRLCPGPRCLMWWLAVCGRGITGIFVYNANLQSVSHVGMKAWGLS